MQELQGWRGGSFSKICSPRLSAASIRLQSLKRFQAFSWLTSQKLLLGTMSGCQGATVTLIRGADVPRM
eukprot:5541431-Pyramimonas_sp.AAC.1